MRSSCSESWRLRSLMASARRAAGGSRARCKQNARIARDRDQRAPRVRRRDGRKERTVSGSAISGSSPNGAGGPEAMDLARLFHDAGGGERQRAPPSAAPRLHADRQSVRRSAARRHRHAGILQQVEPRRVAPRVEIVHRLARRSSTCARRAGTPGRRDGAQQQRDSAPSARARATAAGRARISTSSSRSAVSFGIRRVHSRNSTSFGCTSASRPSTSGSRSSRRRVRRSPTTARAPLRGQPDEMARPRTPSRGERIAAARRTASRVSPSTGVRRRLRRRRREATRSPVQPRGSRSHRPRRDPAAPDGRSDRQCRVQPSPTSSSLDVVHRPRHRPDDAGEREGAAAGREVARGRARGRAWASARRCR